jgi:pyruvate,water dikinase
MSTEPSRRLDELAQIAANRSETRRIITEGGAKALDRLRGADPGFASEFDSYLEEFGTRALDYDTATPSLAEDPDLALGLIADRFASGFNAEDRAERLQEARRAVLAQARTVLAAKPKTDQDRWERALAGAERAYPVREDNEFYTFSAPLALIRYAALEIGRRLAERAQVVSADDVFFLRRNEVVEAMSDGQPRMDVVKRRRAERSWVEAHPGPASFGKDPGPPPSLDALPAEARFVNQALIWYTDRIFEAEQSAKHQSGEEVGGIAASPGQYQGPARIIRNETEFHKLQPGDVLVCPITSPVWSVLFSSIGALITDTGGILSHPAIIAREYRVPAVVATGNATSLLSDGQIVTVDGAAGLVRTTVVPTSVPRAGTTSKSLK